MQVKELMDRSVGGVRTRAPLAELARRMWEDEVDCLPVVDDWDHVLGVISARDVVIASCLRGSGRCRGVQHVGDCTFRRVRACRPEDELGAAAAAMRIGRVRHLPVADEGGRLVGVLALDDLARAASAEGKRESANLTREVLRTSSALGAPRDRSIDPLETAEVPPLESDELWTPRPLRREPQLELEETGFRSR